jgi:hypothetical protein
MHRQSQSLGIFDFVVKITFSTSDESVRIFAFFTSRKLPAASAIPNGIDNIPIANRDAREIPRIVFEFIATKMGKPF